MRNSLAILLFALACTVPAAAQDTADTDSASAAPGILERLNASGSIIIRQPAAMDERLRKTEGAEQEATEQRTAPRGRVGYRIQVFDDNNPRTARGEAQNRKRLMESRFPELRGYMQFNSPYWRVRMGDFRSRGEAEAMLEEMRHAFPSLSAQLRIVRDYINAE